MDKEQPKSQKSPTTVSTVDEVREKTRAIREGELVELPSGLVFKISRPNLSTLIQEGKVPSSLLTQIVASGSKPQQKISESQLKDTTAMIDAIVVSAVKNPIIVSGEAKDNEISINDISDEDKTFIFQYVQTGVTELSNFRS